VSRFFKVMRWVGTRLGNDNNRGKEGDLARSETGMWLGMGWDRTMVERVSSIVCEHRMRKILGRKEM